MATARSGGVKRTARVTTLKRRSEFLRVRKGARWSLPSFVLEAKPREPEATPSGSDTPRFGFTVTWQIGKAVERNRIRRRLKAAVQDAASVHARAAFDYVVIARRPALTTDFHVLVSDMTKALQRVHRPASQSRQPKTTDRAPDESR